MKLKNLSFWFLASFIIILLIVVLGFFYIPRKNNGAKNLDLNYMATPISLPSSTIPLPLEDHEPGYLYRRGYRIKLPEGVTEEIILEENNKNLSLGSIKIVDKNGTVLFEILEHNKFENNYSYTAYEHVLTTAAQYIDSMKIESMSLVDRTSLKHTYEVLSPDHEIQKGLRLGADYVFETKSQYVVFRTHNFTIEKLETYLNDYLEWLPDDWLVNEYNQEQKWLQKGVVAWLERTDLSKDQQNICETSYSFPRGYFVSFPIEVFWVGSKPNSYLYHIACELHSYSGNPGYLFYFDGKEDKQITLDIYQKQDSEPPVLTNIEMVPGLIKYDAVTKELTVLNKFSDWDDCGYIATYQWNSQTQTMQLQKFQAQWECVETEEEIKDNAADNWPVIYP